MRKAVQFIVISGKEGVHPHSLIYIKSLIFRTNKKTHKYVIILRFDVPDL